MAGLTFRQAVESDHVSIEDLFRATPMGSRIKICFERDPDYFTGARIQATEPCVWGAFDEDGRAVGLLSAGSRRVWLDEERPMRYLSDLRIHPDFQGSSILSRGFNLLRREVFEPGEWAQTLVLEDNTRALDLLTSRRGGLPEYHPAGRYVSWLLPQQRIDAIPGIEVRTATFADLDEMQTLFEASSRRRSFSPILNLGDLGNPAWRDLTLSDFLIAEIRGAMVGILGLWDQSRFQRLRMISYSPVLKALRPLWNAWSGLQGGVALPREGDTVPICKATAIACEYDDPAILRSLLSAALTRNADKLLLIGFSTEDPLTKALHGVRGRKDFGQHFLVGWDRSPPAWREPFAFDVARI
jgi:hypothetical protein